MLDLVLELQLAIQSVIFFWNCNCFDMLNCFRASDYWMSLSDEIILGIFKLLPKKSIVKCAQVCKHWQRLA